MSDEECSPISEVQAWFGERGFRLEFRRESRRDWADLVSLATEKVLAPKYGSGESDAAAALRARERYQQEQ